MTDHQPLTLMKTLACHCPHCDADMEPFIHYCKTCNEHVAVSNDRWNKHSLEDVRSAVELVRKRLLAEKTTAIQFQEISQTPEAYCAFNGRAGAIDRALEIIDEAFSIFAEEKEESQK